MEGGLLVHVWAKETSPQAQLRRTAFGKHTTAAGWTYIVNESLTLGPPGCAGAGASLALSTRD
jgi:hypothetical protein